MYSADARIQHLASDSYKENTRRILGQYLTWLFMLNEAKPSYLTLRHNADV